MKKILAALLIFCLIAVLPVNGFAEAKGKKALFIIAAKDYQEQEFSRPFSALSQSGVAITVASTVSGEAVGTDGAKVRVDMQLADARVDDFDVIVFIGGPGASQYVDDPLAHSLTQDAMKKEKLVAAICMGPLILAKAGVLKGKKATVYPTLAEQLEQEGAKYSAKPVERDGRIITADGPDSAAAFGQEIIKAF
ncbi:MAG: DJ-1/PfpI family protein [Planctomycetota bacterium]